ncbi:dolichyl-phosphate mannosyltransferase polypeptide 3 [Metschnikowia aff. pulcherrima]|uniref:Dolichol-phosphate mannosyltransferase subunit 3 n=1 Tax=Metschnikowia aff. pulcherrima TaxID=2163413 RepID=A0A4P6XJ46_9ASCO|nr:dolichyl-phosphate mannosyltransferase polypeptide 3 [Metschnikowia aff. pulcherrima]
MCTPPTRTHASQHVSMYGASKFHTTNIMTKATETFVAFFAVGAIYFALVSGLIPTGELIHDEILPYLPFWALVTFGAYALGTLGWGVLTFKNKEGSYRELMQQIDEAKAFYQSKGVDLDA